MDINLKAKSKLQAIHYYLTFLQPFHKLSAREIEVLTQLVSSYLLYEEQYKDKVVAGKLYLELDSKRFIRKELGLTGQVFRNYLSSFRKKGILDSSDTILESLVPRTFSINLIITNAPTES